MHRRLVGMSSCELITERGKQQEFDRAKMDLADDNRDLQEYLLQGDFTRTPPPSYQEVLCLALCCETCLLVKVAQGLPCDPSQEHHFLVAAVRCIWNESVVVDSRSPNCAICT